MRLGDSRLPKSTGDLAAVRTLVIKRLAPDDQAGPVAGLDRLAFAWKMRQLDLVDVVESRPFDLDDEALHSWAMWRRRRSRASPGRDESVHAFAVMASKTRTLVASRNHPLGMRRRRRAARPSLCGVKLVLPFQCRRHLRHIDELVSSVLGTFVLTRWLVRQARR
jgi:hypothetical protein